MKKYLFYTLLLVALFIGISATTTFAEETGDLTIKLGLPENYGIYDRQSIGFTVRLTNNGEPVTGTFPVEFSNVTFSRDSITFGPEGARLGPPLGMPGDKLLYYPNVSSTIIKNIPVGTTYEIIPDNEPLDGNGMSNKQTSFIEYYTTDEQTGTISGEENIVNYTLKPKYTKMVVTYKDTAPDYATPYISFNLTFHAYSIIPDAIHYYNSSNPDEKFEMGKTVYSNGQTDFISESITFEKGESIILDDIPIGAQFLITPAGMDPRYSIYYCGQPKYTQSTSGQIWGPNGLEYYYWVDVQDPPKKLTITKELSGTGADMTKEFTFKLSATAFQHDFTNADPFGPLNAEYLYEVIDIESGEVVETRKTKFDDGVAYVHCKAGQKIEMGTVKDLREVTFEVGSSPEIDFANKLYNLTRVTVEEVDCDDYTSEVTPPDRISVLPATVSITNERKFTGTLTIKKEITEGVPEDEEFTMKIKLIDGATDLPTEYEYTGSKEGTLVFEDGVATITLKANESITITGLPMGAVYEITEETDEYDVTYDKNVEEIKEETSATVTNSVKTKEDETVIDVDEEETKEEKTEEVVEEKKEISDPRTGDNIVISTAIEIISFISILAIAKKVKRNKT